MCVRCLPRCLPRISPGSATPARRDGRTIWKFKTHTYVRPRPSFVPLDDRDELGREDEHETSVAELLGLAK